MPDLRRINDDFARILGEAYRPLCRWDGCWIYGVDSFNYDDPLAAALIYAAGGQAWATVVRKNPESIASQYWAASHHDFQSISALHEAVLAWEAKR